MTRVRKLLSLKDLQPIVQDYYRSFPDWKLLEREVIARESGPLLQVFGFQRLSTGGYRPVFGIHYLCVPNRDASFGVQFLQRPLQDIDLHVHDLKRDKVVNAIFQEVVPSVSAPLVPEQVLAMHEGTTPIRSPDAFALAALNGYLGHIDRALHWCDRFPKLVEQLGLGWQEFDIKRKDFLDSLKLWIEMGQSKIQLDRVLTDERRKWGLVV